MPAARQRGSRVLVAGKPVVMTSLQARRFEELKRANAPAQEELTDKEPCSSDTGYGF